MLNLFFFFQFPNFFSLLIILRKFLFLFISNKYYFLISFFILTRKDKNYESCLIREKSHENLYIVIHRFPKFFTEVLIIPTPKCACLGNLCVIT